MPGKFSYGWELVSDWWGRILLTAEIFGIYQFILLERGRSSVSAVPSWVVFLAILLCFGIANYRAYMRLHAAYEHLEKLVDDRERQRVVREGLSGFLESVTLRRYEILESDDAEKLRRADHWFWEWHGKVQAFLDQYVPDWTGVFLGFDVSVKKHGFGDPIRKEKLLTVLDHSRGSLQRLLEKMVEISFQSRPT